MHNTVIENPSVYTSHELRRNMNPIHYKGYEVFAAPEYLPEIKRWTLHGLITLHTINGAIDEIFSSDQRFETQSYAIAQSIKFGQARIDSRVE